jgi:hypothetical protein
MPRLALALASSQRRYRNSSVERLMPTRQIVMVALKFAHEAFKALNLQVQTNHQVRGDASHGEVECQKSNKNKDDACLSG